MFNINTIRSAFGTAPQGNDRASIINDVAEGRTTLIDVRGHDEVRASGKAKGAVHIPLMMLQHHADPRHPEFHPALASRGPIAVYCASGGRSSMATQILGQLGYDNVTNVGGLRDWVAAGGAIER